MLQNSIRSAVREGTKSSLFCKTLSDFDSNQHRHQTNTPNVQSTNTQNDWQKARPFEEIGGPTGFQLIKSHLLADKKTKQNSAHGIKLMQQAYGDILRTPGLFGKPSFVITFNPNDFEIVFRNEGVWPERFGLETLNYHRRTLRADFFNGVEGLMVSQGEAWGDFRTKVNPLLMQPKNVRLYLQKMSAVNKEFIEVMRRIRDPKTNELPANFEHYINCWTLESVGVVALDRNLGLLKDTAMDPKIQQLFDYMQDFMELVNELDNKPSLWKILSTPNYKRLMRAYDGTLDIINDYINEAIEALESAKGSGLEKPEHEKSVLEKLLKIDKKVATVMALDMLIAGVDTTSSTFAAVLLCLAQNPDKQAKLREEVLRVLPNKDSEFTEQSLNDVPYLRACIKEAMRIYPLTVGNVRTLQRDVVLSGFRVPKGSIVAMMMSTLHYDEKYFPRPNEFLPERWLRTPLKESTAGNACPHSLKVKHPFAYLPFGFGARMCIGKRIADLELEVGISRVIRNFNVAYNYSTENAYKSLLINTPAIPLKFEITDVVE